MPLTTSTSYSSPDERNQGRRPDDADRDRLIPFPTRVQADAGPPAGPPRQRRDLREAERSTPPRRRPRRRRHSTPWLQRNALSIAAMSMLVALLGLGFGIVQVMSRPEGAPALFSFNNAEQPNAIVDSTNASLVAAPPPPAATVDPRPAVRTIQSNARVIEPNYTVVSGDTLGIIARQHNTTVERIQAFNANLSDPRTLRIGARLVIPPPL